MKNSLALQGVMGRLEWLTEIRSLFLGLSQGKHDIVGRDELVQAISLKGPEMDLHAPEVLEDKVVFYSLQQVISQLTSPQEAALTWDQVIDCLVNISSAREPPHRLQKRTLVVNLAEDGAIGSACNPCFGNSADLSCSGLSLLQTTNLSALLYLSLAGNSLTSTRLDWPPRLILLNLSHNHLTELDLSPSLGKLQLLNISFNSLKTIASLQVCRSLSELYASHNKLSQISSISRLSDLRVLDLSYNSLSRLEELAGLSVLKHLAVIRVQANSLVRDYTASLKTYLPSVCVVDSAHIYTYSHFQAALNLAFNGAASPPRSQPCSQNDRPTLKRSLTEVKLQRTWIEPKQDLRVKPDLELTQSSSTKLEASKAANCKLMKAKIQPVSLHQSSKSLQSALILQPPNTSLPTTSQTAQTYHTAKSVQSTRALGKTADRAFDFIRHQVADDSRSMLKHVDDSRLSTSLTTSTLNRSISFVTSKTIQESKGKLYGNPIAALMVGPPASRNSSNTRSRRSLGKSEERKSQGLRRTTKL
jgi:hypothetical protein